MRKCIECGHVQSSDLECADCGAYTEFILKKVKLQLVGLDGNAFSIMGAFQKQARREGWKKQEIDEVLTKARSGDYDNLLGVISSHVEDPLDDSFEEEDD